jgi:hypothetical protein
VSATTVKIGQPVTVTLMTDLELRNQSRVPSQVLEDVLFGACLASDVQKERAVNPGGFCLSSGEDDTSLPSHLTMLNGSEIVADLGDVVVTRGQIRDLVHKFTFTSAEAGKVFIVPNMRFVRGEWGTPDHASGLRTEVAFE